MKKLLGSIALIALLTAGVSGLAQAQNAAPTDPAIPGHPRVNEVDQRLENQQQRIDNGVRKDQMGAKQEMRDQKADARVTREMRRDEAKNGGHITKAEQGKMNRQLNKDSKRIHRQRVKGAERNEHKNLAQ